VTRRRLHAATVAAIAAAVATRLPFRSDYLFSWDSANYALAMVRIDVAAHRPHPPGYLGYVLVARLLDRVVHDANASLVIWNIAVVAAILAVTIRMASEFRPAPSAQFVAAAALVTLTSPLLWFYSEIAEIYPSELLVTLLIGWSAWRTQIGHPHALLFCAALLPLAALFKLSAALFMLPIAAYAWWHSGAHQRRKALTTAVAGSVAVATVVLVASPELPRIIWTQFLSATASTSVAGADAADAFERFNRNLRDTFIAAVSMLGVVNFLALVLWTLVSRRLPRGLDRATAVLWLVPWIVLCVFVLIAKPGYLLPVLPVVAVILAGIYARLPSVFAWTAISLQASVNVLQYVLLGPLPPSLTGGDVRYRSKTILQRLASDAQPLTFATASTITLNDAVTARVLSGLRRHCPAGDGVIIPADDMVDARRLMWYFPDATVIHMAGAKILFTGVGGDFRTVTEDPIEMTTSCPVVWLARDGRPPSLPLPGTAVSEPGLGFVIDARRVTLDSRSIAFER
jgi:hypothetical protein